MKIDRLAPLLALLLAACGNSQRVERPLGDVHATLLSMPADANAMSLATTFPGTAYYLEPDGGRLIWHFTHGGKDYGRFVATLSEDGAGATNVATSFEEADEAAGARNLDFLRKIARLAGEASVAAALEGRPVDRAAIQQAIAQRMASDPLAAQVAAIETVSGEIDRVVAEQKAAEAANQPAYIKPGVYPEPGGRGRFTGDTARDGSSDVDQRAFEGR